MISPMINLIMTIVGFAVSATFIVFVCARLLCARIQQRLARRTIAPGGHVENRPVDRSLRGMEPSVVASFPCIKYNHSVFASKEDAQCTVCLGEYQDKEYVRVLPWCGHAFHIDCIDAWLRQHSTCPICRISLRIAPTLDGPILLPPRISRAARARFTPGSVPENLFEQPSVAPDVTPSMSEEQAQVEAGRWTRAGRHHVSGDVECAREGQEGSGSSLGLPELASSSARPHNLGYQSPGKWNFWPWRRWEWREPASTGVVGVVAGRPPYIDVRAEVPSASSSGTHPQIAVDTAQGEVVVASSSGY